MISRSDAKGELSTTVLSQGPNVEYANAMRPTGHDESSSSAEKSGGRDGGGQGPHMADVLLSLKRPIVHMEEWTGSSQILANPSDQLSPSGRAFSMSGLQTDHLSGQELDFPTARVRKRDRHTYFTLP